MASVECDSVDIYRSSNNRSLIELQISGLVVDEEFVDQVGIDELLDAIGEEKCIEYFGLKLKDEDE